MFQSILILQIAVALSSASILPYSSPYYYNVAPAAPAYSTSYVNQYQHVGPAYRTIVSAPAQYSYVAPAAHHPVVATPAYYSAPVYNQYYSPLNQYHSQNHLGEAAYGYSFPGQAHSAVRDLTGGVTGSYSYVGADDKPVYVNYRADSQGGFRVSSNVLPVAPVADLVQPENTLVGPEPVDFTPEVKAAREEHFKAVEEAKARAGNYAEESATEMKSRKKRSLSAYWPYGASAAVVPSVSYQTRTIVAARPHAYAVPAYGSRLGYGAPVYGASAYGAPWATYPSAYAGYNRYFAPTLVRNILPTTLKLKTIAPWVATTEAPAEAPAAAEPEKKAEY